MLKKSRNLPITKGNGCYDIFFVLRKHSSTQISNHSAKESSDILINPEKENEVEIHL